MSADFLESPRFPEKLQYGFTGGPVDTTTVVQTYGGYESRNVNTAIPLSEWTCDTTPKTKDETAELQAFWRVVRGRGRGFRFKDWTDFEADATEGFLSAVSGSTYQMYKRYEADTGEYMDRKISKPLLGTCTFYRTRSAVTTTITPSVNYTTGVVTVSGHVAGDTYTWAGEFDVPVRFDNERLDIRADFNEYFSWSGITVKELRMP